MLPRCECPPPLPNWRVFDGCLCCAFKGGAALGLAQPQTKKRGGHAQGATPALVTYLSRRSCTPCWMARLSSETSLPTSTCHTWCVCGRTAGEGRARDECRSRGPALTADLHFQHFQKHNTRHASLPLSLACARQPPGSGLQPEIANLLDGVVVEVAAHARADLQERVQRRLRRAYLPPAAAL